MSNGAALRWLMGCGVLLCGVCSISVAEDETTPVDIACSDQTVASPTYAAGFDFVFARPSWSRNPAATVTESDGATYESVQTRDFDYDFQVAPRVWLSYQATDQIGLRAAYWQFDQDPSSVALNPPANGFGRIDHPAFGNVDISTTIPGESFAASSYLTLHSLDLEVTKTSYFDAWELNAFAGLRYGELDQGYRATLTNAANVVAGTIDYSHQFRGLGPTLGLETRRPTGMSLSLFATARGSLLIGESDTALAAGEDLDLLTPFRTYGVGSRSQVMPVGDLKLGVDWHPAAIRSIQPFARLAVESQLWGGAGNATSEEGSLGFLGLSIGGGLAY